MDGTVRDRALALLQTLPANLGVEHLVEAIRTLEPRESGERNGDLYGSEPRFRSIFENSAVGIALVDFEGRLLLANRALADMLGHSQDELRGVAFTQITHPEDIAVDFSLYEQLVRGEREYYQIEKRYLRKGGSVAWGRLTASLIRGEHGTGVFGIGMVEDITEIRASREEQTRLVRTLNERVKELTALHGTARLVQDESLPSAVLFARVAALLPAAFQFPERAAARVSYGNLCTATPGYADSAVHLASRFRTADAQEGTIEVVYPDTSQAGADAFLAEERSLLASVAEMLRSTLDRRLTEQARRRSDERLSLAVAATGLGLWEWDLATDRMVWSEQMERLAGLALGAFPGTFGAFVGLTHPDDRALVQGLLNSAIADSKPGDECEGEFRFVRHAERDRWVAVKGRVLRDEAGRARRLLGVALDITSRRTLEDQLHQAQKMEAVGRLAGGVAHDFNNILTVIVGNCELMLLDVPRDQPTFELVSEVRQAAERAGGLTRQLLSFSRKNVIQPTVIDLGQALRQLESMLRRLIGEDIELSTSVAPDTDPVRVDPGQFEQVLLNLVVNARDAMPHGGKVAIEVENKRITEAEATPSSGLRAVDYVQISVTDSGHGMEPATVARVFEPFFTTKEAGKGTGLGLSVAFGIIKQSDGQIAVESEPGRGSTFRVYLPKADDSTRVTAPPVAAPSLPRGSETILVVEDEVMLRKIVRTVLLAQGYRVLDAINGREALALVARSAALVDLVITDVVLPGMSGRDVVLALKKSRPDAGVLFISGYADDALVREGILRAEVGFLQKPFSPSMLIRKVREILDARAAAAQANTGQR